MKGTLFKNYLKKEEGSKQHPFQLNPFTNNGISRGTNQIMQYMKRRNAITQYLHNKQGGLLFVVMEEKKSNLNYEFKL